MTHFATLVLVDETLTREQAEDAVTPLLAPYDENGQWFAEGSRWDWWVVGGRWTGALDPEYDPRTDPRNIEVCDLCSGTGTRPDGLARFGADWVKSTHGCNGCYGTGKRLAYSLAEHERDVRPVAELPEGLVPGAVITPDGSWHEQGRAGLFGMMIEDEEGNGEKPAEVWAATFKAMLEQHPEATAVIVDCHV